MLQAEQFQESPIAIGDGSVFRPNNTPVPGQLTLWHNPKDKLNFSIVFTIGGTDVSCIVASGVKLEFVPSAFGNPI